jgi:hypothetical protein
MGQARQRKDEIMALKANGRKVIRPFILRGKFVDGQAVYDTTGLEPEQVSFVEGNVKALNSDMITALDNAPNDVEHLTFVSYLNDADFIGFLSGPFEDSTPDEVYADAKMTFDKSQSKFPQVGFTYTRDEIVVLGTEAAGQTFDYMAEGSQWAWPNAHAVFEKRGDYLIVAKNI